MAKPSVLIVGLGLMGGSLAAALSQARWRVFLHHRRPEVAAVAARLGYGVAVEDLEEAALADVAVVCTPVATIPGLARRIASVTDAVITDVGSTKATIMADLADLDRAGRFVGSHPMCGSHRHGLEHADPDLYRGRLAIVTPTASSRAESLDLVDGLWRAAGSRVLRFDPEEHDRVVAGASHLPHILASAAAAQLDRDAAPVAAGGFRDTTRVAASHPGLWSDILIHNRAAVGRRLDAAIARLSDLRAALERGDESAVRDWLQAGVDGRQRFDEMQ